MSYTNTWQIVSPVITDDWTDMDDEVTDLKTDIVERLWEDGLHLQRSAYESLPDAGAFRIFTDPPPDNSLYYSDINAATNILVHEGKIFAGYTTSSLFPVPLGVYGGSLDEALFPRKIFEEVVQVVIGDGNTTGSNYLLNGTGTLNIVSVECFYKDTDYKRFYGQVEVDAGAGVVTLTRSSSVGTFTYNVHVEILL